jgi:diadenosine tetraphosphate (Ap4A) HIT family hydrolase
MPTQEQPVTFTLHPQLDADTWQVKSLELCDLLLMNDSRFLWCILVPRREGLRDLHQVAAADKPQLLAEIDQLSGVLESLGNAYKMNVAALGNMVEQLHVHVIARTREDAAWPGPVWGVGKAQPYQEPQARKLITQLRDELA